MVVILKNHADEARVKNLTDWLQSQKLMINEVRGEYQTILGLIGDTSRVDIDLIQSLDIVEDVKRISEPYKCANRNFHPDDTVVEAGGHKIGGGNFQFFAGPCSVESREQIIGIAKDVKAAGANFLRGGAFKPRTSPYAFQGMGAEGLELLLEAKKETGMPIITEIMDTAHIPLFEDVDIIQVGARNMQNFELLKELGHVNKPIFLKRGLSATLQELLMSAEYIMAGGNENVILCERGIRTFEPATRNTLDISAIPLLKEKTHLPVVVDPSHASGIARLVEPMAYAAAACGADGIMIEVHNDPAHALCDGPQALTAPQFAKVVTGVEKIREALK
ncbi:MAG: 3-deoxy-7-phosphoheptulonate synthase [Oscillospiraceae bacterium]|nr:3-deoxy-7-phosphoheptulonate synthase [Oscillospiraceae bacterium]